MTLSLPDEWKSIAVRMFEIDPASWRCSSILRFWSIVKWTDKQNGPNGEIKSEPTAILNGILNAQPKACRLFSKGVSFQKEKESKQYTFKISSF